MLVHRIRRPLGVSVVLLTGGLATALPASAAPHHAHHHADHPHNRAVRHAHGGIPQHNGGDRDGDNNGAPSDGDGNQ